MAGLLLPLTLGLYGASSLLQYGTTRAAGRISRLEAETMAKQEELAVIQREADRKEALVRAMAAQNAEAGAKGIKAFEGSPLSVLMADIEAEKEATQRDQFMSQLSAMTTRQRGKLAQKQGLLGANISLLGDVGKLAYMSRYAPSGGE